MLIYLNEPLESLWTEVVSMADYLENKEHFLPFGLRFFA